MSIAISRYIYILQKCTIMEMGIMKVVYLSGSPRKNSNTDAMLRKCSSKLEGELIKLSDYNIKFCTSCYACLKTGKCIIEDDMSQIILPKILEADAIFVGTPVYFNNVSAQLKAFIDRSWPVRGKLRNKIGASLVVGRKYGHESATNAINSFFLKHDMVVANRGVCAMAFEGSSVQEDAEAMDSISLLCKRVEELHGLMRK